MRNKLCKTDEVIWDDSLFEDRGEQFLYSREEKKNKQTAHLLFPGIVRL